MSWAFRFHESFPSRNVLVDHPEKMIGNLLQEARGDGALLLAAAETTAISRPGENQALFGSGHADVSKSALFFHRGLFGLVVVANS